MRTVDLTALAGIAAGHTVARKIEHTRTNQIPTEEEIRLILKEVQEEYQDRYPEAFGTGPLMKIFRDSLFESLVDLGYSAPPSKGSTLSVLDRLALRSDPSNSSDETTVVRKLRPETVEVETGWITADFPFADPGEARIEPTAIVPHG